jgi:hypothetical protein
MPVPKNITREHVFQAIIKILIEGEPDRRKSTINYLIYEGREFSPKLVLSWANLFVNGEEIDNDPKNYQAEIASDYLIKLGFTIRKVPKNN